MPQNYFNDIPRVKWVLHIKQADRKNLVMFEDDMMIETSHFSKSRMEEMNDFGEIIFP